MFKGLITAVVTPFNDDGSFDEQSYSNLIKFQQQNGVDGIVVAGTTGESPTITTDEFEQMLKIATKFKSDTFKIIASVGTNNTEQTIERANIAQKHQVDGVMVVAPYYNKPQPHSLYAHYKAINDAINTPIMLYNIPARNGIDMKPELVTKLLELSNVVCIKDATANLARPLSFHADDKNTQLSGDDHTLIAFCAMGGDGVVSAAANFMPQVFAKIMQYINDGDYAKALHLQKQYLANLDAAYCDTNPIAIKYMLFKLGVIKTPLLRLPLTELSDSLKLHIDQLNLKAA